MKRTNDPRQMELPLPIPAQAQENTMPRKSECYPSKYFKAKDYPDDWTLTVEIEMARLETFDNGNKGEKVVTYFRKQKSGLVTGPTLFDQIADVTGEDDSDNWKGHRVTLFRDTVLFQGRDTPCIRVRAPDAPPKKPSKKSAPKDDKPPFDDAVEF